MIRLLYVGCIKKDRFIYEAVKGVSMVDGFEILFKSKDDGHLSGCSYMLCMYDPKKKNNRYGMPNKLYLALKYHMPVIVSENTDAGKFVRGFGCGYTCEYSLDAFVSLLKSIPLHNTELLSRRASDAYMRFNWETDKKELLELYGYKKEKDNDPIHTTAASKTVRLIKEEFERAVVADKL